MTERYRSRYWIIEFTDIFREVGLPQSRVSKLVIQQKSPPNWRRSILSDHAHFSYLCHVAIYKVEPLNKNIAVSLLANQHFRKWREAGSDYAWILIFCVVILKKQTPLNRTKESHHCRYWCGNSLPSKMVSNFPFFGHVSNKPWRQFH